MKKYGFIILAILLTSIFGVYFAMAAKGPTNGLVGYWTFDGKDTNWGANTTNDLSGSNNTGTMISMSTTTSPVQGIFGQALKFDGTNDYVLVKSGTIAATLVNSTSVIWFKTASTSISSSGMALYSERAGSPGSDIFKLDFYYSPNFFPFFTWRNDAGNLSQIFPATAQYNDNKWHQFAVVIEGTAVTLYIDGAVSGAGGTISSSKNFTDSGLESRIGGDKGDTAANCSGSLDELRIYNRALTQAEITSLYNLGLVKTTINKPVGSGPIGLINGLVGYWSFDGATTTWSSATAGITGDLSGNYYTGTLTNMSQITSPTRGVSGQAFTFDGVNDCIRTIGVPTLANITISMWVKPTIIPSGYGMFISRDDLGTASFNWWLGFEGNSPYGRVTWAFNEGAVDAATSANPIVAGVWTHVVATYDGLTNIVYINSASAATFNKTSSLGSTYEIDIGCRKLGTDLPFTGAIDDVRLYNRALSQAEITTLYNQGLVKMKINTGSKKLFINN